MLWVFCEIAIAACDHAVVIGSAIALNLLFHSPLIWGVIATSLDVLLILVLQQKGFRRLEAFIIALIITIGLLLCRGNDLLASGVRRGARRLWCRRDRSSPIRACSISRSAFSAPR